MVRIASFLPSATEIAAALGLANDLVGRSHECDFPPEVRALPPVVRTRIRTEGRTPAEIDAQVRAALRAGESLYEADIPLLERLKPDLLLTQDLCSVCAPSGPMARDVERALGGTTRIVSLNPHSLDDVLFTILQVGEAAGVADRARALAAALRARLDAVRSRTAGARRRRVAVLEWTDPPFTCGHWVPEQVAVAGGDEVLGRAGQPSRTTTWEEIARARPEVVIVAPCGYHLDRSALLARDVLGRLGFAREVWAVDADSYFARPGPRVVDGAELLADILHGDGAAPPRAERIR
jgi:iron complex transport system substrate-binding protein